VCTLAYILVSQKLVIKYVIVKLASFNCQLPELNLAEFNPSIFH